MPRRSRLRTAVALLVIVALGLISRHHLMPELCVAYVGDVLWGSLFFALAALAQPAATTRQLWLAAIFVTELIEVSQLYQAPWAQTVRATRVGGLMLGHSFPGATRCAWPWVRPWPLCSSTGAGPELGG